MKKQEHAKERLRAGLNALPEPENEYALVMPELAPEPPVKDERPMEEDAEDMLARIQAEEKDRTAALLRRRSTALQRELPRPVGVNFAAKPMTNDWNALIRDEVLAMLKFDAAKYPLGEQKKKRKREQAPLPKLEEISDERLKYARGLVESELAANQPRIPRLAQTWEEVHEGATFLPSKKAFGRLSVVSEKEQMQALEQRFNLARSQLADDYKAAAALESKAAILNGGFMMKMKEAAAAFAELHNQRSQSHIELQCFVGLQKRESVGIPARLQAIQNEVSLQMNKERELQSKYAMLMADRDRLQQVLAN